MNKRSLKNNWGKSLHIHFVVCAREMLNIQLRHDNKSPTLHTLSEILSTILCGLVSNNSNNRQALDQMNV